MQLSRSSVRMKTEKAEVIRITAGRSKCVQESFITSVRTDLALQKGPG